MSHAFGKGTRPRAAAVMWDTDKWHTRPWPSGYAVTRFARVCRISGRIDWRKWRGYCRKFVTSFLKMNC